MLIAFSELKRKYSLEFTGAIQVGCHWAEEHDELIAIGIKEFVYIEPCKEAFAVIYDKFIQDPKVHLYNVACADTEGRMTMYASSINQGQSNSLLAPKLHLDQHREVVFSDREEVEVVKLDNLDFDKERYNFLVMDCQGAEGLVLKGAVNTLRHIDAIYTECNRGETYQGNMQIEEMDEFLKAFGFTRVETFWPSPNWTWGDCLYIKNKMYDVV